MCFAWPVFASGSQSFFLVFMFCSRVKAKADLSLSLSFQYKSCTLLPNRETEDMDRHAFKSHQIPCNPPVHTWWWWWSSYAFVHGEWKEEKLAFRQWTSWSMWSAFSWMSKINNPSSSSTTLHTHTHTHLTHSLPFTHVDCHLLLLWTAEGGGGGGGGGGIAAAAAAAAADLSANNEFIRRVCHSRTHNNWRHGGVNNQSVLLSSMNINMNVCMHACMYVCMCVCMSAYMYVYICR